VDGGLGQDFIDYLDAPFGVIVNLTTGKSSGGDGKDAISGIENVAGSAFDDTIIGDAGPNYLSGVGGADLVLGLAGNDTFNSIDFLDTCDDWGSDTYINCGTILPADSDGDGHSDADELQEQGNPDSYCAIVRADLDSDASVSVLDLTRIAGNFGKETPPADPRLDQDNDWRVSVLDLTVVAGNFGKPVAACP
jgi:hypothetical protein